MRQIVLDTETTGLDPKTGDRIVEIGCVEIVDRIRTNNNFHVYINPERDMPEAAFKVHGLTSEFLSDKPKFAQICDQFINYVNGAELIIHNAQFDVGFLNHELSICGKPLLQSFIHSVIDTIEMAREMFPGKRHSLDALCERLEVNNSNRTLHGALLDAELLSDVYINMTRGQNSLLLDNISEQTKNSLQVNLQQFNLPIIKANEQELSAHEKILDLIEKKNNNKAIWRNTNLN